MDLVLSKNCILAMIPMKLKNKEKIAGAAEKLREGFFLPFFLFCEKTVKLYYLYSIMICIRIIRKVVIILKYIIRRR